MYPSLPIFVLLSLAILGLNSALAQEKTVYQGNADVGFRCQTNLFAFPGKLPPTPITVVVSKDSKGRETVSMNARVAVKGITTNHRQRDRDIWEMFEHTKYPHFTVRVNNASMNAARPKKSSAGGETPGRLTAELEVRNKKTPIQIATHQLVENQTGGSVNLKMVLSLKALGLTPPTALFGTVKVEDEVAVDVKVTLRK